MAIFQDKNQKGKSLNSQDTERRDSIPEEEPLDTHENASLKSSNEVPSQPVKTDAVPDAIHEIASGEKQ